MTTQGIHFDDPFAQTLLTKAAQAASRISEPKAFYNSDGDCIEVFLSADSYRAERLSDLLTIYLSRETGVIVGILMKGVKQFLSDLLAESPGFQIEIRDGKVRLAYLLTAAIWKSSDGADKVKIDIYRAMREEIAGANLELDLQLA